MLEFDDLETVDELYNHAPCGYYTHLADGTIIKINDTLLSWLGYKREEVIRKISWTEFLTMGSKIYYETHFFPLLQIQDSALEIHFDLRRKDGSLLPVLFNTLKIYNKEYQTNFYRTTVFDITQRKSYERELLLAKRKAEELTKKYIEKNEQLMKFAYVVSHDLRSPVSNMIMMLELIHDKFSHEMSDDFKLNLSLLDRSAQKMIQFIQDILKFYQNTEYSYEPEYNFHPNLLKILDMFLVQGNVEIRIPKAPILIPINPIALEQILINLITNAIKYNDKEKIIIEIDMIKNDKYYIFTIQDNGRGISPENQEKIFQAFTSLKTKDRYGNLGTGIGLATIKKMIENFKGKIELESKLNEGSLFRIFFPLS
jgi:PAS domain S-box-containing protein